MHFRILCILIYLKIKRKIQKDLCHMKFQISMKLNDGNERLLETDGGLETEFSKVSFTGSLDNI